MVLDPLSALGVAGNIVQFVDFTLRLVSKTDELYERGSLIQHEHLHRCAQQIQNFSSLLKSRLTPFKEDDKGQRSLTTKGRSANEAQDEVTKLLRVALSHCHESATELLKATSKLVIRDSNSKWQSFRQALNSIMSESALDVMTQRVFQAQQNVVMFLLLYTSSPHMDEAHVLQSGYSLEKNILSAVNRSADSIRAQIEALRVDLEAVDTSKIESFTKKFQDRHPRVFDTVGHEVRMLLPIAARETFLETLKFESINDRYDRITLAHKQTLQWVLEPSEQQQLAWDSFPAWLEARDISENPVSFGLVRIQTYPGAAMLFWNPGNVMQRSMEGLLRTLAHQALSNHNVDYDIIPAISPLRWHDCMYRNIPDPAWSLSELMALLRDSMTFLSKKTNLMLFVDGLDEFGTDRADRETLIQLFLDLRQLPNVKLCLSSRPWNEFKDSLGAFPHLKLEDLTKQDMRDYVQAELGNSRALQDFASVARAKVDDLQCQLVDKSDGVFLWLFLVTRRLKLAAQDGKQLRTLFEILDQMPPDLDEFFQHMLRRIPAQDQIQASRIFQIMINSDSKPTLMDLSFTEEEEISFALLKPIQTETKPEILSRTVALRRRLDSQCMDLLVCAPTVVQNDGLWDATQVEYLHRTVKDFLETKDSQELLLSFTTIPLDAAWYECNATISQMIFTNELIHDWSAANNDQQNGQRHRFQKRLQRLWTHSNFDSQYAKQVFELAVDEIDPLLKDGDGPIGFSTSGEGAKAAEQICRAYERYRSSTIRKHLLMALMGGFDKYATAYVADLEEHSDTWTYFYATVAPTAHGRQPPPWSLLIILLQKCRSFETVPQANSTMEPFHEAIRNWPLEGCVEDVPGRESYSKVALLLLQKTEGLSGFKWQLQELYECCERNIRATFDLLIAVSLIRDLQKARKTWRTAKGGNTSIVSPGQTPQALQPEPPAASPPSNPNEAHPITPTSRPSPMPTSSRKENSWMKLVFRTKH
ncbi:hypothetical protein H2200_004355 [Cladophialophora chaetospira]|uniref:NACHT domain-containing protein n=1 Tax=Cladophialophora chaetospira TaxID=386627 RepID=A0AA38XD13_9EURO|nr:hypothetical protein H2200_004355 [Cladophialophora chaetospira]